MSTYATVYLEKLNINTKKWELFTLYDEKKTDSEGQVEYNPLPLWEGQGIIRDILRDRDYIDYYCSPICVDDENNFYNLGEYLTKKYHYYDTEYDETSARFFDYHPDMHSMTYAQLLTYLKAEPKVYDPYAEDEEKKISNPIKEIVRRIDMIIDMKNAYMFNHSELNEVRIVFWVD